MQVNRKMESFLSAGDAAGVRRWWRLQQQSARRAELPSFMFVPFVLLVLGLRAGAAARRDAGRTRIMPCSSLALYGLQPRESPQWQHSYSHVEDGVYRRCAQEKDASH